MVKVIIIIARDFFKSYWSNHGQFSLNEESRALKGCADIFLELNRIASNPNYDKNFTVKIPLELRTELTEKFGCIVFSELFHDTIAEVDNSVNKLSNTPLNPEEAVIETAKVYNDTSQIIIVSDCPELSKKVIGINNVGVAPTKSFFKAFERLIK